MKLHIRTLERFNLWFTSAIGVWQTIALIIVVVVIEAFFPQLDEHGFWLMWGLTLYSGATQPILAYVAARSADSTDHDLSHDIELDETAAVLLKRIATKLEVDL